MTNPNLSGLGLPQSLVDAIRLAFQEIQGLQGSTASVSGISVIEDTRVNRDLLHPAAGVALGSLYIAADQGNVVYICKTVAYANAWVYLSGVYPRTQAQLAALFATLTNNDIGMRVYVSDFVHTLWHTVGGTTDWAPEDDHRAGEGPVFREIDPSPTTGWKLYDGSAVTYLKADGTLGSVTLPDLVSTAAKAAYLKAGSPNSAVNVAVAPTITGVTLAAAATGVTASMAGTSTVQSMTVAGAGLAPTAGHVHPITVDDPTHTHTTSGGTVSADGQPQNVVRRPWFRQ